MEGGDSVDALALSLVRADESTGFDALSTKVEYLLFEVLKR